LFEFNLILASSCEVINTLGAFIPAAQCTSSGNTITLTFPDTISFPLGINKQFRLNNLITTPFNNGTYLFDITSYLSDGITVIESWTDYLTVSPIEFAVAGNSLTSLDRVTGVKTVLTAQITTTTRIPAGVIQYKASDTKGFIELEFKSAGFASDLGFGITSPQEIPCYVEAGLSPSKVLVLILFINL